MRRAPRTAIMAPMASVPVLAARGLAQVLRRAAPCCAGSTWTSPTAPASACSARTAAASRRCCGSSPGSSTPDAGTVTCRRGLVNAFLPQLVPGDERDALATVLAARPELAALQAELARAEARLADPALAADLDAHGPRARPPGAAARALGGGRRRLAPRARRCTTCARSGSTARRSGAPRASCRAASASSSRSPPASPAAPTCCCSTSPRRTSTWAGASSSSAMIEDFDGAVVMVSHDRYLLDECVGGDRRARPRARAHVARRLLRVHGRPPARARAPAAALRHPAEGDRPARGGGAALQALGAHPRQRARGASRRASSRCRSTAWTRSTGRCSSAAAWASPCAAAARGGQRVVALEGRRRGASATTRCCSTSSSRSHRGERVGVVGPNGAGKSVLLRVLAGELGRDRRHRWAGRGIEIGYLSQAADRLPAGRHGHRGAAVGPVDVRGGRGAPADALPVRLRAGAAPGRRRSAAASARGSRCCC